MKRVGFLNIAHFTILTVVFYVIPTKITAQESSFVGAPAAGGGSKPTVSRALLLFSLFTLFYNYVSESLFSSTTDPDAFSVDSEQNLFVNVINTNLSLYDQEFVPNEIGHPHELFSDNQIPLAIGPLTSSDLQEIELMANQRDNSEQNNLHSENRENDAVEKYSIDLNILDYGWLADQLNPPHVEESRRENDDMVGLIDLNTSVLSEEIEHMDHGNLHADEERVNIEVIDLDTLSSSDSGEIEHNLRPDNRGAETTVDHNCSRGAMRTERECGITLTDLQQRSGKKVEDAAQSLGVSRSTFKRICRSNGIARWSSKRIVQQPATATLTQTMATIVERGNSMSIKASYNGVNVKFPLNLSSGKNDLEFEVEKRFGIQTGSFWINYEDEEKDWILITCDKDLHHGMQTCIERGIHTMKMLVTCDLG